MVSLPKVIQKYSDELPSSPAIFLVGGAVRDALLSKENKDIDFVCGGDARADAMAFANRTKGDFFMLDEKRNTCRVILHDAQLGRLVFDFAQQRGQSLEEDLAARDFTINAMALPLAGSGGLIDPLKGARDLQAKVLNPCAESSFRDDPLRVIRAIRYATAYNLIISANTLSSLKAAIPALEGVSKERKRDEVFKILELPNPWVSFHLMHTLSMLEPVGFPAGIDFNRAFARLKMLRRFLAYLVGEDDKSMNDDMVSASFLTAFKPLRQKLRSVFLLTNSSDRTMIGLDGLAAILWGQNLKAAEKTTREFLLSNDETGHCLSMINHREVLSELVKSGGVIDDRQVFHYFNRLGPSGLNLVFLQLAELASVTSAELNDREWLNALSVGQILLDTWVHRPEVVHPRLILSGRDLMFEFDLTQGPLIGQLLDGLREEQAAGAIKTREEAKEWVEQKLTMRSIGK